MLRRREVIRWFTSVLILACPLALSGADTELQGPKTPIAHLEVQATRIDWLPQVDYERLVLTVAGPDDVYIHQVFEAGQAPQLSLLNSKGDHLPDGIYAYELRVVSRQDQELRQRLAKAREKGDDSVLNALRKEGGLPENLLVQSGHLWVQGGSFVDKVPVQTAPSTQSESAPKPPIPNLGAKDIVKPDDLIVQGQACIGTYCVIGDANVPALKLKELFDTRITFENAGCCHPSANNWALQANDFNASLGDFLIRDLTYNTIPFRLAASAPDNAFTVFFNGNVGLGTLTPAVRLDVKTNDAGKATERLQNSSATGYSGTEYLNNAGTVGLFFGIDNAAATTRLNSANNNPIVVLTNSVEKMRVTSAGDVGVGTASPATQFHLRGTDAGSRNKILVENAGATNFREMLEIRNNGGPVFILKDMTVPQRWGIGTLGSSLTIDNQANPGVELSLSSTGNLTISGIYSPSDRSLKKDIEPVSHVNVLAKLATLPIATWTYKTDDVRHIGPMAQDFAAAFGLGIDDKHISPNDMAGVSMAAVQALYEEASKRDAEIAELKQENTEMTKRLADLERRISSLAAER